MYPSKFNKHLEKFKDVNKGKSAILFATGPSIKKYQPFEGSEEAIKFGVNRIYVYPEFLKSLDYYFFGSEYFLDQRHQKNLDEVCTNHDFVKFAAAYENGISHADIARGNISPERAKELGAIPFENNLDEFSNDISRYALLGHSIVFPALQIILYTGVSKIYLVGCDGGETGQGQLASSGNKHFLYWWSKFKEFRDEYYSNVEVISINPVSLRGVFPDNANVSLMLSLFKKDRSLLADDNLASLELIGQRIPLEIHSLPSGTECFDWEVPRQWNLKKGVLKDSSGKKIIDAKNNILHVLAYSSSFKGEVTKDELLKHLYFDEELPEAIPYRTTYYSDNWGFCLSYNDFKKLKDDTYAVEIESGFKDGELLIGEAVLHGKSDREIILSSYYCHPQQANDGLSGVVMLVDLYNKLKTTENRKYTYRFFFWPETIGALAALSHGVIHKEDIEFVLVATTVGYGDRLCYKKTYLGNHSLDNLLDMFKQNIEIRDFTPTGSDERQFSSPGIRIPTGVLTRTPYEEYREYHTSADNLDLVSIENIEKMADLYFNILSFYEKDPRYLVQTKGGEPFLTRYNLYRQISFPGHTDSDRLRNWVLFLCDGKHTVRDMAAKTGYIETEIEECLKILIEADVISPAGSDSLSQHEKQLLLDYKEYYDDFEGRTWRTVESFEYCLDFVNMVKREIGAKDKKILEFGCGSGFNLNYLYHCGFRNLHGLDICAKAIEIAKNRYRDINFGVITTGAEFGQTLNSEGDFDFIFCRAVLQQQENTDYDVISILYGLSSMLKPNGLLVLSEGASVRDWDRLFLTASFQTIFRDGDIRKLKKISAHNESRV